MLDKPPKEAEWLSWVYAGLLALLIFFTVPFARAVQEIVSNSLGREFFLYAVALAGIAAAYTAYSNLRKRCLGSSSYFWLLGVGAAFSLYSYSLRKSPEEAMHFVEYGALSVLVYRALVHRVRDYSIFVTATIIVGTVGIVDEAIQWITPSRVWDLRDIWINFVAGGLAQLAIGAGLRPSIVTAPPNPASLRMLCRTAALGLFLLGLTLANTPERIARYALDVPRLSFFLDQREVVMAEYGYMYRDPDIGVFRSRFTKDELAEYDRLRGAEVAAIMDEYVRNPQLGVFLDFWVFLTKYNVPSDAYVHEAGIHLRRRNRYFTRALSEETDRAEHYNIALRENRILEVYFPRTLSESKHLWTEDLRNQVSTAANDDQEYESPVSSRLITRVTEGQVMSVISLSIVVSLLLASYYGRRIDSSSALSGLTKD